MRNLHRKHILRAQKLRAEADEEGFNIAWDIAMLMTTPGWIRRLLNV